MPLPLRSQAQKNKLKAFRLGHIAESIATLYLRLKGYRILARRYKTQVGEIDILMRTKDTLIAVEVKARKTIEAGLHSITPHQRRRIERTLAYYCTTQQQKAPQNMRFDVIIISKLLLPHHIKNAWRFEE